MCKLFSVIVGDEAMQRLLACKGKDPYRYGSSNIIIVYGRVLYSVTRGPGL